MSMSKAHSGVELDLLLFIEGRAIGFEFKMADAPTTSKSMHQSIEDLNLAHLFVIYPGTTSYPMREKITAWPVEKIPALRHRVQVL